MLKKVIRAILNFLIINISSLFFKREYLKSWYFTGTIGWQWIWRSIFFQKILRINSHIPFPVSPGISISNHKNLDFHLDDMNNFQMNGSYFQNFKGKIIIGRGTYIGPNVGIITANHNPDNLYEHEEGKDVVLGEKSWIGMNAMILPGVVLGEKTVVGAGSVVTKSFPEGHCVIAGNPAQLIRRTI